MLVESAQPDNELRKAFIQVYFYLQLRKHIWISAASATELLWIDLKPEFSFIFIKTAHWFL